MQQKPIDPNRLYSYLRLESFSDSEIESVFLSMQQNAGGDADSDTSSSGLRPTVSLPQFQSFLQNRIQELEQANTFGSKHDSSETEILRQRFIQAEAERCWDFLASHKKGSADGITSEEFLTTIKTNASALDTKRVYPLALSMILVGSSVGVTTPAMPFVVQNLGLTAGEYGLVVSAFAVSKMTGNIPSAVLVERYGRKPYLVYTLAAIAVGVGGIGLAGSFEHLYLCRLVTGLGVAGLSTGVTMTVTDISTPLNRASSFAPIMSGFSAGTALGPALGGFLCDQIGVNPTFYVVGVSYLGLAAVNSILLNETLPTKMTFPWQQLPTSKEEKMSFKDSFQAALGQWAPLLAMPPVRNVCIMNGFYWMGLAGSQMTLLPLILTDVNGLAMTPMGVGQVYMGMSIIQVMGNPVLAKYIDTIGKVPGIVGGCTLLSAAMLMLPLCSDIYQMSGALGVWAVGSTLLATSPVSYMSDSVDDKKRAQAIALMRTSGDVGFLVGATSMGALADMAGSLDIAMQSSAAILLTATTWFAVRSKMTVPSTISKARK
eukprot:Nitzschia sp. Nitz4//scaffold5_size260463//242475//244109//NITZ4_001031-RA/size260463-processed-gene-0.351-mRNA-1//1//CDS//3329555487//8714//frame0